MAGYFELINTPSRHFVFTLKSDRHELMLTSEVYVSKQGALAGILQVQKYSPVDGYLERRTAEDNSPYFRLMAANHQVVATSPRFASVAAMESGIRAASALLASGQIKDLTN